MIGPLDIAHLASERDTSRYVNAQGVRLPSVTEVLALAGLVDLSGIPVERLEAGAARGRIVHHLTAGLDRGERVMGPDAVGPYLAAWARFRDETGFKPLMIERSLVSHRYSFAGTLDRFGEVDDGRLVLGDIKSSVAPSHWWALQLAGYQILLEEDVGGLGLIERWGIQLGPDGGYRIQRYRAASDRGDFLAALRVAHWLLRTRRYVLP